MQWVPIPNGSAKVVMPSAALSGTLEKFHPNWKKFATLLDGAIVTLLRPGDIWDIAGWYIQPARKEILESAIQGLHSGEKIIQWVPDAWLCAPSDKTPCTCPLSLILRSGCQDSSHE